MNQPYISELIDEIASIKNKKELYSFIQGILTPKELSEVATRLQIVKMLKKGMSQHEIANKLKVGVATVTRGSKELQRGKFKQI